MLTVTLFQLCVYILIPRLPDKYCTETAGKQIGKYCYVPRENMHTNIYAAR